MKRTTKWLTTLALPLVFTAAPAMAQPGPGGFPGGPGAPQPPHPQEFPSRIRIKPGDLRATFSAEPQTYLGIAPAPMPEPLRAQLDLPEGFGLVVGHVEGDSPAAKAGVEPNDVLHKLDDQLLVNPEQLVTLIHAKKAGDTVTLHLIRKGKPLELKAALLEKKPEPRWSGPIMMLGGNARPMLMRLSEEIEQSDAPAVPREEILRKLHEIIRMLEQQPQTPPGFGPGGPGGGFGQPQPFGRPGGFPSVPGQRGGFTTPGRLPEGQAGNVSASNITLTDNDHAIVYTVTNGEKHLLAKDAKTGEEIFNGPVNTEEQLAEVPEPIRNKIKNIQIRTQQFPRGARPGGFPGGFPGGPGQPQVDQ